MPVGAVDDELGRQGGGDTDGAAAATAVMASWLQSTVATVTVWVGVTNPAVSFGPTLAAADVAETTTEAATQATRVRTAAKNRRG